MTYLQDPQEEIYAKPIAFDSQYDLFSWCQSTSDEEIAQVDSLSFTLVMPTTPTSTADISKLVSSLSKFTRLHFFGAYKTLLAIDADLRTMNTYNEIYGTILRHIPQLWPSLRAVAAHTNDHSLSFLRPLALLRRLQFTGYSISSPMETVAALADLRYLEQIDIMPSLPDSNGSSSSNTNTNTDTNATTTSATTTVTPAAMGSGTGTRSKATRYTRSSSESLSREVLRSLRSIHALTLHEHSCPFPNTPPPILTPQFLISVAGTTGLYMPSNIENNSTTTTNTTTDNDTTTTARNTGISTSTLSFPAHAGPRLARLTLDLPTWRQDGPLVAALAGFVGTSQLRVLTIRFGQVKSQTTRQGEGEGEVENQAEVGKDESNGASEAEGKGEGGGDTRDTLLPVATSVDEQVLCQLPRSLIEIRLDRLERRALRVVAMQKELGRCPLLTKVVLVRDGVVAGRKEAARLEEDWAEDITDLVTQLKDLGVTLQKA